MPDIGYFHPQLVHFTVVLCAIGVAFRLVSLTGRARWTHRAAPAVLLAAALITVATAKAGDDAHGLSERIPGAREAVHDHEEWGERTRNMFLIVAGLEVVALALRQRRVAGVVRVLSALGGTAGLFLLYEAAEHGGEVVYSYGGGVGTRSGDSADVTRLLVAGLYQRALADRAAGRAADAGRLFAELGRRRPDDPAVYLMTLESRIKDQGDPAGALELLRQFTPGADQRLIVQHQLLLAQAYAGSGHPDSALAILDELKRRAPGSQAVEELARAIQGR
jgi:uncharacterized membrane protein